MSDSEEEIIVTVEFSKLTMPCVTKDNLKIIGLETDKPIVKCDKQVFKGEWFESIGTKLFMKEAKGPESSDPVFSSVPNKHYECWETSTKVLKLSPQVLVPREAGVGVDTEMKQESSEGDQSSASE